MKHSNFYIILLAVTASLIALSACSSTSGKSGVLPDDFDAEDNTGDNAGDVTPRLPEPDADNDEAAYADMFNGLGSVDGFTLRGRIVEEERDDLDLAGTEPADELSQDELKETRLELVAHLDDGDVLPLGAVTTDDEGYLDVYVDLSAHGLEPGTYTFELGHKGISAGRFPVRLLSADHSEPVVRSDVDLTYLNTDFHSSSALLDLLFSDAADRQTLPAMETVYQELRAGEDGARDRPLTFLSGSPRFFKRTLESRMVTDRVAQDGLVLKPFKDIVATNIGDLTLTDIVGDLKEQIGYKLYWVLRLRTDIPASAPEILMGDDSEADVVVYVLYHRFTAGELDAAGLMAELERLEVAALWRDQIAPLLPEVEAHLGGVAPVVAIYINRTPVPSAHFDVADWAIDGLTRHHQGAWPLILDLFEEGWVKEASVLEVKARLTALGQSQEMLDAAASTAIADGSIEAGTAAMFE